MIFLANGYNPIFDKLENITNASIFLDANKIWIEHYVKSGEILLSIFYKISNKIELAKALNYIFAISTILFVFHCIFVFYKKLIASFILSCIIALSPVVISQINTYCIDLLIAFCLLNIICAIILIHTNKHKNDRFFMYFLFIGMCVICFNIKLSSSVYICVIGVLILIFYVFSNILLFRLYAVLGSVIIVFCILSSFNPYITNILQHKNVFYPLVGKDKIDIMASTTPASFLNLNRFEALFISTFSKTQNIAIGDLQDIKPSLKLPFSIHKDEQNINVPDMKVAGFGHFFSAAVLLAILLLFKIRNKAFLFLLFGIFCSVIINPNAWWARYVPQLYFIVALIAIFGIIYFRKFYKFIAILIVFILGINLINPIIYSYARALYFHITQEKDIQSAREFAKNNDILIFKNNDETSFLIKLNEANIKYKITNTNFANLAKVPSNANDMLKWNVKNTYNFLDKNTLKRMDIADSIKEFIKVMK